MSAALYWGLLLAIPVTILVSLSQRLKVGVAIICALASAAGLTAVYLLTSARGPHTVRVQLWPDPSQAEFEKQFVKDRDVSLVLSLPERRQIHMTDFGVGAGAQYLEKEISVEHGIFEDPWRAMVTPRNKYRLQSYPELQPVRLVPLIVLNVLPQGRTPIYPTVAWVPFVDQALEVSGAIPGTTPPNIVNAGTKSTASIRDGQANTLILTGENFSLGSVVEWEQQRPSVGFPLLAQLQGRFREVGWLGNEVGVANGKPLAVSADGRELIILGGPNEGTSGYGMLRIRNENGTAFEYPIRFAKR